MPYTAKQRRMFNARADQGDPEMAKLADEANALVSAGKEKAPVAAKKAAAKKTAAKKGMGFKAAQANIAKKEGVSKDRAGAILASATRKASPAAKKANPNLKKVKGK